MESKYHRWAWTVLDCFWMERRRQHRETLPSCFPHSPSPDLQPRSLHLPSHWQATNSSHRQSLGWWTFRSQWIPASFRRARRQPWSTIETPWQLPIVRRCQRQHSSTCRLAERSSVPRNDDASQWQSWTTWRPTAVSSSNPHTLGDLQLWAALVPNITRSILRTFLAT